MSRKQLATEIDRYVNRQKLFQVSISWLNRNVNVGVFASREDDAVSAVTNAYRTCEVLQVNRIPVTHIMTL
jgi:hypothetical protein